MPARAEAALAGPEDRGSAVAALTAAREVARRLGAHPLLDEIDGLARRARLDLAPAALAPAGRAPADEPAGLPDVALEVGLTARELEVLEHVALGQTNRQIAADLFISARTAASTSRTSSRSWAPPPGPRPRPPLTGWGSCRSR